jgi:hypothetical protein
MAHNVGQGGRGEAAGMGENLQPRGHHFEKIPVTVRLAQALYDDKRNSIATICKTLNVSRATLYRYLSIRRQQQIDDSSVNMMTVL